MKEDLLNTWNIHNRTHLYVLSAIEPVALTGVSASKGRSVGEQFAHIHNVRLMWLKAAAPELMGGLAKVEKEESGKKDLLKRALESSGRAVESLLKQGFDTGKIKGFKPNAAAFLGYMISHESHHRGQIALSLKQSGHPLDKKIGYGMWEWGVR